MVHRGPYLAKVTKWVKVGKWHLVVQGWQRVSSGKGWQHVYSGPRLAKGTCWSKIGKGYLVIQGWQRVPSGPRLPKGT